MRYELIDEYKTILSYLVVCNQIFIYNVNVRQMAKPLPCLMQFDTGCLLNRKSPIFHTPLTKQMYNCYYTPLLIFRTPFVQYNKKGFCNLL